MINFSHYAKAIIAFFAPGVATLAVAITVGSDGGAVITSTEWIGALIVAFTAAAGVYTVPNASVSPDGSADEPEVDGEGAPEPLHAAHGETTADDGDR